MNRGTREEALERMLDLAVRVSREQARSALEPLRLYDEAHHADLLRTLAIYLRLGCNASRTAERLYLHRSGLLYRLSRIESLLGIDLSNFDHRVALEVAVLAVVRDQTDN